PPTATQDVSALHEMPKKVWLVVALLSWLAQLSPPLVERAMKRVPFAAVPALKWVPPPAAKQRLALLGAQVTAFSTSCPVPVPLRWPPLLRVAQVAPPSVVRNTRALRPTATPFVPLVICTPKLDWERPTKK